MTHTKLASHLLACIQKEGPLSVERFMSEVLMHPHYGYYQKQTVFGSQGDFITAPEISQLFGETIGIWCVLEWQRLGQPSPFCLAELGPGRGTLLLDLLRATRHVQGFHAALTLYSYEQSERLYALQQQRLHDAGYALHRLIHLSHLPAVPTLIISNEFFDALPIKQYIFRKSHWVERLIASNEKGEFIWVDGTEPQEKWPFLPHYFTQLRPEEGKILEFSTISCMIMQELLMHIRQQRGTILMIDYGYERLDGQSFGDTLQAVKNHQYTSIFENIGEADITAHVDFSCLMELAKTVPTISATIRAQSAWLQAFGIVQRAQQLHAKKDFSSELDRLLNPLQMGQLFKVLELRSEVTEYK